MKKFSFQFSGALVQRLVLVAAVTTGALSLVAGHGTMAWFTTTVSSTANTFTAGTLRLFVGDVNEAADDASATASITFANMKPGDVVYAPIEMLNDGSLPARYGMKYTTTTTGTDLAPGLKLAVSASGTGTGTRATVAASPTTACSSTNFANAVVWADVVRATTFLVAGGGETISGVASLPQAAGLVGGRDLAADGGRETLCLQVTFTEPGAGVNTYNNSVDGATNTTLVFVFDGLVQAAQVITNP